MTTSESGLKLHDNYKPQQQQDQDHQPPINATKLDYKDIKILSTIMQHGEPGPTITKTTNELPDSMNRHFVRGRMENMVDDNLLTTHKHCPNCGTYNQPEPSRKQPCQDCDQHMTVGTQYYFPDTINQDKMQTLLEQLEQQFESFLNKLNDD